MPKSLTLSFALVFLVLAGCSNLSRYDDDEPAAIVRGKEITVGELRFIFADQQALDYLPGAIQLELVKQEVEKQGLDISKYLQPEGDVFAELPPADTEDPTGIQIREYAEAQAKKLQMKPEEYQREFARRLDEQNAYMLTYLDEILGPDYIEEDTLELNQEVNQLLEELVEENQDEIEVLIKN